MVHIVTRMYYYYYICQITHFHLRNIGAIRDLPDRTVEQLIHSCGSFSFRSETDQLSTNTF